MKYCYNCNRITAGQPLFCNFCGRSFNVKLCPRHHVNPRNAETCSQCGSRDLSTPQPKIPWWAPALEFGLSLMPGVALGLSSLVIVALFLVQLARKPDMLLPFVFFGFALGILWWAWAQIPRSVRTFIYRMLKRKRDGDGRKGGH